MKPVLQPHLFTAHGVDAGAGEGSAKQKPLAEHTGTQTGLAQSKVGPTVGICVGAPDGALVGTSVGASVGIVGADVGHAATTRSSRMSPRLLYDARM